MRLHLGEYEKSEAELKDVALTRFAEIWAAYANPSHTASIQASSSIPKEWLIFSREMV